MRFYYSHLYLMTLNYHVLTNLSICFDNILVNLVIFSQCYGYIMSVIFVHFGFFIARAVTPKKDRNKFHVQAQRKFVSVFFSDLLICQILKLMV